MRSEPTGSIRATFAPASGMFRIDQRLEGALQSDEVRDLVFSYLRIDNVELRRAALATIRALQSASTAAPPVGSQRSLEAWPPS